MGVASSYQVVEKPESVTHFKYSKDNQLCQAFIIQIAEVWFFFIAKYDVHFARQPQFILKHKSAGTKRVLSMYEIP